MSYSLAELLEVNKLVGEIEQKKKLTQISRYRIFCDMDGVVSNFKERFNHFAGVSPREYENKYGVNQFWKYIDETIGEVFWSEMGWTPSGKQLWKVIGKYSPTMLTAPSRNEISRTGKEKWVRKNLSPTPPIIFKFSNYKHEVARPGAILIDDKKEIISNWERAGGIGIHHPENLENITGILDKLKELGYE